MKPIVLLKMSLLAAVLTVGAGARKTVILSARAGLQAAVDANDEGTMFVLREGRYLRQEIVPKEGDIFIGDPCGRARPVMDGEWVAKQAFLGKGQKFAVSGIEITGHNNPPQTGAVSGANMTVENCDIHHNAGGGVHMDDNCRVRWNHIHHNGQLGVHGGGDGSILEGNEIDNNNPDRTYDPGWEAGGSKFAADVSNLLVKNNYVHDNQGPGLWTDVSGRDITYEGNIVEGNHDIAGIFHEISYAATIRCNISRNNCSRSRNWLFDSQIQVSTSSDVDIYHNTVVVPAGGGNGICIVNQNRGSNWFARDCYVHHNDITYLDNGGITGVACDYLGDEFFDTANNRFDYNNYHASSALDIHWETRGGWRNWEDMRGEGQELNGAFDTDLSEELGWCDECAETWADNPFLATMRRNSRPRSSGHAPERSVEEGMRVSHVNNGGLVVAVPKGAMRLDIYSFDGRRVAGRDVSGMSRVAIAPDRLCPGVCVLRLRGRRSPLTRTVALR